ncbi:MAG TPA: hypothetical protein VIX17_08165 [Pyrinomonadaceae bacterium]
MTLKLIASLLLLSCGSLAAIPNRQAVAPYKITAVKAMLFYDNKGTFSPEVAEPESDRYEVPSILWNTPLEGSTREGAATSMLVTVEVEGEYALAPPRQIELVASYKPINSRRERVVREIESVKIRESGKYIAGFWLKDVGCSRLQLSVRILGQRNQSKTKRIVRFGCGE